MTIEEIENEKFENFAKQFENVPKEKVIKFLYEALEKDEETLGSIEEIINYCECVLEDNTKKQSYEDIKFIKTELEKEIKYTQCC